MQKKIFIWFVLIVVIPSGLIYFMLSHFFINYSIDKQITTNNQLIDEMRKNLDTQLLHYQQLTMQFYLNDEAMNEITSDTPILDCHAIGNQLSSFVNTNRLIASAYLFSEKGNLYSGHGLRDIGVIGSDYREPLDLQEGRILWTKTYPMLSNFGLFDNYFFGIRHIRKNQEPVAALYLGFNSMFFKDFFQYTPFMENQVISIYDQSGNLISTNYSDTDQEISPELLDKIRTSPQRYLTESVGDQEMIILSSESRISDWILTLSISPKSISKELSFIQTIFYISLALYFLFFFSISYLISKKLGNPLRKLTEAINEVSDGNLDITVEENHIEEIRQLSVSFNYMTHRIGNLLEEVKETERAKRKAYLQTLQLQLTPHFLYNTLNTIRWMAQINGQDNITSTTKALITYLKSLTDIESEFIELSAELSLIGAYATIQRYRYKDFTIKEEIPEDVEHLSIHKLMILNIVENSIIHGFSDKSEPGVITISAHKEDEELTITISDNGVGIEPDTLEEIRSALANQSIITSEVINQYAGHIGLLNIQGRLHLYHGKDYSITIESELDEGCTITIRQPVMKEKT